MSEFSLYEAACHAVVDEDDDDDDDDDDDENRGCISAVCALTWPISTL